MTDIAIAHKDFDVRGGGEVFARRLAEALDAPLYVGRRNLENEPDADIDIIEIPLSRVDKWMIDRYGLSRTFAYMTRWQAAAEQLADYDVVITSGNEPLWYVGPDEQTVIAYTHSTPRFMYDLYPETMDFSGVFGRLASVFNAAKRAAYESNVNRPDFWIANSDLVARRMEKYWNLSSKQIETVYPPVDVSNYSPDFEDTGDYYLHLGRLADHKNIEEIVEAFSFADEKLIIAGEGPMREALEKRATDNIEFVGFVDEAEKRRLYAGAKALVYPPLNEDFGMVPIEAMSSGTPVIGVRDGFTKYQVLDGDNGLLYDRGPGSLYDAINEFEASGVEWTDGMIASFAHRHFGIGRFEAQMRNIVEGVAEETQVTVPWDDAEQPASERSKPVRGESSA
mgnify:CR=1 FL=1